jgi:hypothetical protein
VSIERCTKRFALFKPSCWVNDPWKYDFLPAARYERNEERIAKCMPEVMEVYPLSGIGMAGNPPKEFIQFIEEALWNPFPVLFRNSN